MKEFDKQLAQYIAKLSPTNLSNIYLGQIAHSFWKEALKWVLKNCPLSHIGREKIQEELGKE